jgi:hypothetical protein
VLLVYRKVLGMNEDDQDALFEKLNSMDSHLESLSMELNNVYPLKIIDKIESLGSDLRAIQKDVEHRIVPNIDRFLIASKIDKMTESIGNLHWKLENSNDSLTICRQELRRIQSTLALQGGIMMWVLTILLSLILWRVW